MVFYIDEKTKELFLSHNEVKEPKLSLLEHQSQESLNEKHIPKVEIDGHHVKVKVGDIMHPMTDEHYISFIFLETTYGGQIKYLTYSDKPIAEFVLADNEEIKGVYEYCTLHGLWRTSFDSRK
jgi:Desulfoferrodoxin